jgi:hypothetical protein
MLTLFKNTFDGILAVVLGSVKRVGQKDGPARGGVVPWNFRPMAAVIGSVLVRRHVDMAEDLKMRPWFFARRSERDLTGWHWDGNFAVRVKILTMAWGVGTEGQVLR